MNFTAMDFETADRGADSACAVALIKVEEGKIVDRYYRLIKPPRRQMLFTYIHKIEWKHVADKPTFAELWPEMKERFKGSDFIAAHNASFDRRVLDACCEAAGVVSPRCPYLCTVQLARKTWGIRPTKLNNVCDHLGIELVHHEALSDAHACAQIVLSAHKEGAAIPA